MWTLRSRSARRKRRSSRSLRASVSAANRSHGRMMANGQRVAGRPICRLFGSLLELCDELLDLEPQSLEGGEELRLELALELLALFEEILHQVAEPVRQLPPSGDGVDLGRFAWLAFLRQRVHPSLLVKGPSGRLQVYAREGEGVREARARSETAWPYVFTTRLRVYASVRLVVGDRWPSG